MKGLQVVTTIGGIALVGLGTAMALTNPGQDAYEKYAGVQMTAYLKDHVCTQAPKAFGDFLQRQCTSLVDTSRPQLQQIIAQSTQRQNFIFFSIYKTDLSVSSLFPSYHFESVGAWGNFYIYQAQKQ